MSNNIYYIRESFVQSFMSDSWSIALIIIAFLLNYKFIDGNNFLDFIIFILFFFFLLGRGTSKIRKFNSDEELVEYLKNN